MSLKEPFPREIPEETREVVEGLLGEGSVYRLLGHHGDEIISDADFEEMYAREGRPGVNPMILCFVSVFQFMEKLPDRQAAEMSRLRLDWKYGLRQDLSWRGFHYSDLCNFRKRLLKHGQERELFEKLVSYLRERGHIKTRGKQRTDATHMIGDVMRLSRLELVWESLRLGLSALISHDAPWTVKYLPASFVEEYSRRRSEYRLSKDEVNRQMQQAGQDGYWLLGQVNKQRNAECLDFDAMKQLKRVLDEQFKRDAGGKVKPQPDADCTGDVIDTPHDPDVRYGNKGGKAWSGYKLQVTETVDVGYTHFITDIDVTSTLLTDHKCLDPIQQRLECRYVPPGQQYVDGAYMTGKTLKSSQGRQIDLRGYVRDGNSKKPEGFRLKDFDIDVVGQTARCPADQSAISWKTVKSGTTRGVAYRANFGKQCRTCRFFGVDLCTSSQRGRQLDINLNHDLLQARRRESQSDLFATEMHHRNGIEGTISELVRSHGARRSRYRGVAKNQLQAYFIAVATNLKRLANNLALLFCKRQLAFAG